MKKAYLLLLLSALAITALAEDDTKQVLVFRNTGEINLFYESSLDSIVTSRMDTTGTIQDTIFSQIFYAKDTTMLIPIHEIDSVVFGNRNAIEFKSGVRILDENDLSWIIRAEATAVYYKLNTPATILPKVGQVVFYPEFDSIFPYGLAGKVTGVQTLSQEIKVSYEQADYADIFEHFFFAGEINSTKPSAAPIRRVPIAFDHQLTGKLPITEYGQINISGTISTTGNVVLSPLTHYYHADMQVSIPVGFDIQLTSDDSGSADAEIELLSVPLPPVAYIFHPSLDVSLVAEIAAEMNLDYSMTRTYDFSVDWTRREGNNQLTFPNQAKENEPKNEAKIDLTINGSVFTGLSTGLEFNLVGDVVGVEAEVKVGAELSGSVSMGMLQDLREYNPELYGNAQLTIQGKAALAASLLSKNLIWGETTKTEFFKSELTFAKKEYKLFPEYKHTAAVKHVTEDSVSISAATKVDDELIRPLDAGFEIIKNDVVLDSLFADTIQAEITETQGYQQKWSTPSVAPNDSVQLRPIFHYAGHTIAYADVAVSQNPNILPYIAHMTNGSATFISGAPIIGYAKADSTAVLVGNLMYIPHVDTFFVKESPFISPSVVDATQSKLLGTWSGEMDGMNTTLVFNGDNSGVMTQMSSVSFDYATNSPQHGNLELKFADSSSRVFRVTTLNATILILWDKKKKEYCTFNK